MTKFSISNELPKNMDDLNICEYDKSFKYYLLFYDDYFVVGDKSNISEIPATFSIKDFPIVKIKTDLIVIKNRLKKLQKI